MRKNIITIVVFLSLYVVGVGLSVACYQESYITTLLQYHDTNVYVSYSAQPIIHGTIVRGEMKAVYDNFAAVKLRINTFNRMNTTHIIFRLKEKGSNTWYIESMYALDRFENGLFYPFGFLPIHNAMGKIYDFEVLSNDGTSDNAIGVLSGSHAVSSQYVFSKSTLLTNKQLLIGFMKEKLKSIIEDSYSVLYFGMFSIPALAWLGSRVIHNKRLLRYVLAILCGYLFLVYIYLPVDMSSNTAVLIATFGYFIGVISLASASVAYTVALICLLEIPFTIAFGNTLAANKLATLIFFSMIVGGIMSLKESRKIKI